jgi:hypothetical protein
MVDNLSDTRVSRNVEWAVSLVPHFPLLCWNDHWPQYVFLNVVATD